MSKIVGERIRSIRLKMGWTLERFGEEFSPIAKKSVVSNWELGKNLPNKKRMNRIAELGGMSISELMEGHYGVNLIDENKQLRKVIKDSESVILSMLDGGYKSRNDIYSVLDDIRDVLKVGES